jgi:AAA+ superfamily predicted ATPase
MSASSLFDYEIPLPEAKFSRQASKLVGFSARYDRIKRQLELLLRADELETWSRKNYKQVLPLCSLIAEQYPLVIFHGDVGTGKTATAECVANELVVDSKVEDSLLYKLSNRVRGGGKVGEMGTLITDAFKQITSSAGKSRRAILIIDEGDSLAAARSQQQSHHEDKVGVNTLIQNIDNLRQYGGRVVTFLCTNRLSVLDSALRRRAAVVEEFTRPSTEERKQLLEMDLHGLNLHSNKIDELVDLTGQKNGSPVWTFSDLRTRLYPAAIARAFPDRPLKFEDLHYVATTLKATPVLEDK